MKPFFLNTAVCKSEISISHQEHSLLLGSCFTENIGDKLSDYKFKVTTNPFGIIYNPISLANVLDKIVNNFKYSENDLEENNDKYFSFNHHGSFSSFNKNACLDNINKEIKSAQDKLSETKTIVITFGTAWVYELVESHRIVANCHKLPAKNFNKRLLLVDEILQSFSKIVSSLKNINFIFTVSPVRHISDGLHENNLSKSVLHLAIHQLMIQHKNCSYFGAYEMVIDELRDYRFYKEDMIHPSSQAVDYVWEKFADTYFSNETKTLNLKIEKIQNAVNHRPFNFDSSSHQQFIKEQIRQMEQLCKEFPMFNFDEEISQIQQKPNFVN